MSDKTGIEWTDATWNPVWGCTAVSPGCDHCYAETLVNGRLAHLHPGGFNTVRLRPEQLDKPLRWQRPRRIFVNSMSDLFHDDVPDDYIARVFAVMALAPRHTFQVLTKRHGRMRSLLNSEQFKYLIAIHMAGPLNPRPAHQLDLHWPRRNVWLGVSVENQQWADIRIPALFDTPAAARFLSCEPLLGPLDLDQWCHTSDSASVLDWVIAGGESGPGARPMHPDWARSLRDQCQAAGVPFLFKQWGEWRWVREAEDVAYEREHGDRFPQKWECIDRDGQLIESNVPVPGGAIVQKVGKHQAGRELDGRTWNEYPREVVPA